jgi:L-threonylcarbamoyladenylate synthase
MAPFYDCSIDTELLTGMRLARAAIGRGELVVLPTDTVYGIAADAFQPEAVARLRSLVVAFWPGGLTIILPARSSLQWDLGDTDGTVALRMPSNRIVLEILSETGPLAVSSANRTGEPAAMTAAQARDMLGDSAAVYLEDGEAGTAYPDAEAATGSTIVDATGLLRPEGRLRIVRSGVIPDAAIREIVGDRCE